MSVAGSIILKYRLHGLMPLLLLIGGLARGCKPETAPAERLPVPVENRAVSGLPAFPGAEGFGSTTPGGRGGRVLEVTNLNDRGPGSFREACEAEGPRIVVFRTGGIIRLQKKVIVDHPYLTIAGQSAPGDGICISGAQLHIAAHDVIVRGLRIRIGDDRDGAAAENRDGITISNPWLHSAKARIRARGGDPALPALTELSRRELETPPPAYPGRSARLSPDLPPHNIIIDHCSISWGIDENISTWFTTRDVTIQWCIISEALDNSFHPKGRHSKGLLIGGYYSRNISLHHNLLAHNDDRNPRIQSGTSVELINNVIYNWRVRSSEVGPDETLAHLIGNYYKPGPDTHRGRQRKGIMIARGATTGTRIYLEGNFGEYRRTATEDDWAEVEGSDRFQAEGELFAPSGIGVETAQSAYQRVLAGAGATAPQRDAVDVRVVREVRNGSGRIIDSPREVGGWPAYAPGAPPPDRDQDGMPDAWEVAHGLDPDNPDDGRGDRDGDGYTNVEEYLNGLIRKPGS